jgi:hypothetical protein
MKSAIESAVFAFGLLLIGVVGTQAQTTYSSSPYSQSYPTYGYTYSYPGYSYPGYSPYYVWPYQSYLGDPYPAPLAYWDPYVWYRPYSDNAGPKASGHGGF